MGQSFVPVTKKRRFGFRWIRFLTHVHVPVIMSIIVHYSILNNIALYRIVYGNYTARWGIIYNDTALPGP